MSFPLMPLAWPADPSGSSTLSNGGSFTVPFSITSINVEVKGARGGNGGNVSWNYGSASGGAGGYGAGVVNAALAVTPGETLTVSGGIVGSAGANYTSTTVAGSGGNGGSGTVIQLKRGATVLMSANGGGGGGGASCGYGGPNEIPYENAGSAGGNSGTGTGGTVTSGGGVASGGGTVTITWG